MAPAPPANPVSTDVMLMLGYNAMLLVQVFVFGVAAGNILWVFWVENVLMGITAFLSLRRAKASGLTNHPEYIWKGEDGSRNMAEHPGVFVGGYGTFSAVHMVFTVVLGVMVGVELTTVALVLPVLMVVGREVSSNLATARLSAVSREVADRRNVADAMARMIVLHLVIIVGWILNLLLVMADIRQDLPAGMDWLASRAFRGAMVVTVLVIGKTIGEYIALRRSRRIAARALVGDDAVS